MEMSNIISTKKTVTNIIRQKLLDSVENSSIHQIINRTLLFSWSVLMWLAFTYPQTVTNAVKYVLLWNNEMIFKMTIAFVLVFHWQRIRSEIQKKIPEKKVEITDDCIEWIPVFELLDHLFTFWSFKRDDVEKKFGIPRNRFTELAQKLEDLWILMRWPNNSRIINQDYSRQDVARILSGKQEASELKQEARQESSTSFTFEPIGKHIKQKRSSIFEGITKHDTPSQFKSWKVWEWLKTACEA